METVDRTTRGDRTVRSANALPRVCEMCGTAFEIDTESGEYSCPLCDIPEE